MRKRYLIPVYALLLALLLGCVAPAGSTPVNAVAKAKLKTKKMNIKVGQTRKIALKNKNKKAKYTYKSSSKAVASVSKKGKVTAKSAGKAKVTVKEKLNKKTRKVGTVKVVVTGDQNDANQNDSQNANQNGNGNPNDPNANPNGVQNGSQNGGQNGDPNGGNPNDPNNPDGDPSPTEEPTPRPTTTPRVLTDTSLPSGFNSRKNGVAYGQMSTIQYYSETTGKNRKAVLLLPPNYTEDKQYPVLYLFHGGNGDENDWKSGNPDIVIGNLIDSGECPEMIVVMPNCRARANDAANPSDSLSHDHMDAWTRFLDDFQNDLMPYMAEHYSILEGRENTAVGGFSMGGREALYLGFSIPETIGYMGAFSPAFGLFEYENWGLHEDGYFDEDNFTLPDEYFDDTLCLIMNGQNDSMVRNEPERYHNALVKSGFNHFYYTVPGDHDWNVWNNGFYNYMKLVFK